MGSQRQKAPEAGAFVQFAFDLNSAAIDIHDLLNHHRAGTCAGANSAREPVLSRPEGWRGQGVLTVCSDYHTIAIMGEKVLIILLMAVNLAAGIGFAVPIARLLGEVTGRPARFSRYFAILVGAYFVECMAFSAGMGTQVFSVGMAFLWGIILGLWLRSRATPQKVLKTSFLFALYSCLPTVSFGVLILLAWLVGGWLVGGRTIAESILSTEAGADLGIPDFVPWPLNTILGFCSALVMGTVVLKTVITAGEVSLLIHLRRNAGLAAENL